LGIRNTDNRKCIETARWGIRNTDSLGYSNTDSLGDSNTDNFVKTDSLRTGGPVHLCFSIKLNDPLLVG
jgi:hypothetical protein